MFRTQYEQSCTLHTMTCPPSAGSWYRFIHLNFSTHIMLPGSSVQALLEKNPDHRASLWHLKEHEWILQEVKQYPTILSFELDLRFWSRWMQASTNCMMSSLALSPSCDRPPITGITLKCFLNIYWAYFKRPRVSFGVNNQLTEKLKRCLFLLFWTLCSGKEVGGWQEGQGRPSAEAQVWHSDHHLLWFDLIWILIFDSIVWFDLRHSK